MRGRPGRRGESRGKRKNSLELFSDKRLIVPVFFFFRLQDVYAHVTLAAHRIGARLSGLSPEQLVAFIDEQAPLWSAAAMRVAEEHAARLVEQPEWVLSEVLLSPDLAPHILAQLPTKEHAVKGTCRAWRRGWKESLPKRERPRLLVFGGHDTDGSVLSSLERYDPAENTWGREAMAPMPTARRDVSMAVLNSKLYTVGGQRADLTLSSSAERYDFASKAWENMAPMAAARSCGVAVLDGKLYAVGGRGRGYLKSVERYDPATDAWESVAAMSTVRCCFGVAALEGKLYAVGGLVGDASVERYDPALNAWETVAPMAQSRANLAVAVLDGKLYAVGGFDGVGRLNSVERYDPAQDAWEAVAPMARVRQAHGVAVLDGKLYAVGGSLTSSVERYDPAANAWELVAPMTVGRRDPYVASSY